MCRLPELLGVFVGAAWELQVHHHGVPGVFVEDADCVGREAMKYALAVLRALMVVGVLVAATYASVGDLHAAGVALALLGAGGVVLGFVLAEHAEDDDDLRPVWPAEVGGVE